MGNGVSRKNAFEVYWPLGPETKSSASMAHKPVETSSTKHTNELTVLWSPVA